MSGTQTPPDTWATAEGKSEDQPVVYRFRMNRPHGSDWRDFPHALQVLWPYDGTIRNGMPPEEVHELQFGFEEAILSLGEGGQGYLMIVATGNGRRRWLYYVRDPERWVAALNDCLQHHDPYPLDIENWPDAEWTTWQDFADSVTQD